MAAMGAVEMSGRIQFIGPQPNSLEAFTSSDIGRESLRWWQYDERTSRELEASYKAGDRTCELLIAGFLYIVDFEAMVQMRRHEPARRRHIKRDLATVPKKGIAGIKQFGDNILDSVTQQISSLSVNDQSSTSHSLPCCPAENTAE